MYRCSDKGVEKTPLVGVRPIKPSDPRIHPPGRVVGEQGVGLEWLPGQPIRQRIAARLDVLVPNASYPLVSVVVPDSSVSALTELSQSSCTKLVVHVPGVEPGRITSSSSSPALT